MADYPAALRLVFSRSRYLWLFAILLLILIPLYAILTDIYVLSYQSFNISLKILEAALIAVIAVLSSLGFTLAAFQAFELRTLHASSKAGIAGTLLGTFSSACPVCQPIWLVWLGFGSVSVFLTDYSIYLILASIAMLAYSIHSGLGAISKGCKTHRQKQG